MIRSRTLIYGILACGAASGYANQPSENPASQSCESDACNVAAKKDFSSEIAAKYGYLDDSEEGTGINLFHPGEPLPEKTPSEKAQVQKAQVQRTQELKAQEQKAAKEKAQELKAQEQKAAKEKAQEPKTAEQKTAEQKTAEQKTAEEKAAKEKAFRKALWGQ